MPLHPLASLLLAAAALAALAPPARAVDVPPAAGDTAAVRLIWFGRTGGVSGQVGRNRAHLALYDRLGDGLERITPLFEGPRVFVWRDRIAFAPGGLDVATFHQVLGAGPHTRRVVRARMPVVESPFELLLELPTDGAPGDAAEGDEPGPVLDLYLGPDALLPGLHASALRWVRYTAADGATIDLLEPPDAAPLDALPSDPAVWEIRWAFQAAVTPTGGAPRILFNVGRPLHDGARRLALIQQLRSEDPTRTLVLAAGDDIETFSFTAAGQPDHQRPNTWESFRRMGLTALVPGGAEAAFGLDRLQREAQEHEVTLLGANVDRLPFAGWRLVAAGPIQVLLVGIIDPRMRPADRRRGFGDRIFGDEAAAVDEAVRAARRRIGRRPDLVVAIGHLDPSTRGRLLRNSGEIDLLLADFADHGLHREALTAALATPEQQAARARERHPLPLAPAGSTRLGLAEVQLVGDGRRWHVAAVESQAVPVSGDMPAEPFIAAAVQDVRQSVYGPAQVQLLPDLGPAIGGDPVLYARFLASDRVRRIGRGGRIPARVTADLWRTAVANVVADQLDAEVVLLPPIPFPWSLDGPVTTLQAVANLNTPDRLRARKLSAAELKALTATAAFGRLATAGITLTADGPMVHGRPLDDREVYRVAFADGLVAEPEFAALLGAGASERFEADDGAYTPLPPNATQGRVLPLRDLAVDALGARARAGGADAVAGLMHPTGAAKRARWVLDLQQLGFEGSLYSVAGAGTGDDYAEVRETRVRTLSHRLVTARGDAYLTREGIDVDWVNRLHLEFGKGDYDDAEDQETADDVRLSTELQVPPLTVPGINGVPFVNLAFATEVSPTEGNPRKKQVEGTIGLLWKGGIITQARGAALVVHDFSTDVPDPQLGALAALGLRVDLPSSVWTAEGELRYFIPGIGVDDPSELGIVAKARTTLAVPLFARLSLGLYVDLFAYRGQVPATHDPGASIISGLSLKYDHRLKLAGAWW